MTMFAERYFTQDDAKAVAGMLALLFADLTFDVCYQGIYGDIGTPGSFAYAIYVHAEVWRPYRWINNDAALYRWLAFELDFEQARQIMDLIRSATSGDDEKVSDGQVT